MSKTKKILIAIGAVVGGIALLCAIGYGIVYGVLTHLFSKTNYISEPEISVPSSWDVDEDGIGASTDLEDLINQLEKEEAEKNQNAD
ncbi:MAG: hypothetical protein J6M12_08565 [Clostridia bacterium]|nr:hypothetical protein [Clostridia bacterium]